MSLTKRTPAGASDVSLRALLQELVDGINLRHGVVHIDVHDGRLSFVRVTPSFGIPLDDCPGSPAPSDCLLRLTHVSTFVERNLSPLVLRRAAPFGGLDIFVEDAKVHRWVFSQKHQ